MKKPYQKQDRYKGIEIPTDELNKDLLEIINDSKKGVAVMANNNIDQDLLLFKLVSYIVRRDHKIFDHAFKVGKASQ